MKKVNSATNAPSVGKRDLILDTALKLFVENGYIDTKIIDIANAAGIGKGTIYEYFSSKEALFTELLQHHVVSRYACMKEEITHGNSSCREQLRRYIHFDMKMAQQFSNGKNFIDQLYQEFPLDQYPDLRASLNRLLHYRLSTLIFIITEGVSRKEFAPVDPTAAAFTIMGAIGAYISYRCGLFSEYNYSEKVRTGEESYSDNENTLLEMLLHGLAGEY